MLASFTSRAPESSLRFEPRSRRPRIFAVPLRPERGALATAFVILWRPFIVRSDHSEIELCSERLDTRDSRFEDAIDEEALGGGTRLAKEGARGARIRRLGRFGEREGAEAAHAAAHRPPLHMPDREALVRQLFDLLQSGARTWMYPFIGTPPKPHRSKPASGATSWDAAVDDKRLVLLAQRPGMPPAPRASGVARWRVSSNSGNVVWRQAPNPGPARIASTLHHAGYSIAVQSSSSTPALSPRAFAASVSAAAPGRRSPTATACTECGDDGGGGSGGSGGVHNPGTALVSNQPHFEPSNLRQMLSRQLLDAYPHEKAAGLTLPPRRQWLAPAGPTPNCRGRPPPQGNLTRPTRMHLLSTKPRGGSGASSSALAASQATVAEPAEPTRRVSRSWSTPTHPRSADHAVQDWAEQPGEQQALARRIAFDMELEKRKLSHTPGVSVTTCRNDGCGEHRIANADDGGSAPLDDAAAVEHALRLAQQAAAGRTLTPQQVADMLAVAEALCPGANHPSDDDPRQLDLVPSSSGSAVTAAITAAHASSSCSSTWSWGGSHSLDKRALCGDVAGTSVCTSSLDSTGEPFTAAASSPPDPISRTCNPPGVSLPSEPPPLQRLSPEEWLPLDPGSPGEQRARRWQLEQAQRRDAWWASRQRQLAEQARMHDLTERVGCFPADRQNSGGAASPLRGASPRMGPDSALRVMGSSGMSEGGKRPRMHVLHGPPAAPHAKSTLRQQAAPRPRPPHLAGPWATPLCRRPPTRTRPGANVLGTDSVPANLGAECSSAGVACPLSCSVTEALPPSADILRTVSWAGRPVPGGGPRAYLLSAPPKATVVALTHSPSTTSGPAADAESGSQAEAMAALETGWMRCGGCSHVGRAHDARGPEEGDGADDATPEMTPEQMLAEEAAMLAQAEAAAQAAAQEAASRLRAAEDACAADDTGQAASTASEVRMPLCTPSMSLWGMSTAEAMATATAVSVASATASR